MTALIATITDKGVLAPTYSEVLAELQKKFRAIYGQDINLDNDTADGQWLGIVQYRQDKRHQPEQGQLFQCRSSVHRASGFDHFRMDCRG